MFRCFIASLLFMRQYDHKEIESKWQKEWAKAGLYKTPEDSAKRKCYVLDMFPYPSGEGLHVGHPKGYIGSDIYARYKKMTGYNVLHPMGWDAFGLPAENYALKNKTHPREAVEKNIARFKAQLEKIGFSYDWEREINTTDPEYYKWTQWIFLQLFKKGLAYESHEPINWCPSCKTGLALEDLEGGKCERCGSDVEQKPLRQWVLKIREYADRLLADVDALDWPESVKEAQRNWIGRSEGANIRFKIYDLGFKNENEIELFTTRPDTLFGATYLVLSPEHQLISNFKFQISNWGEVEEYIKKANKKTDLERTAHEKEKTGVELKGIKAINPATKEEIPVWIADYVLAHYGTGAIMAVPAHDERDFQFAQKFNLPIKRVISHIVTQFNAPPHHGHYPSPSGESDRNVYSGLGELVNSGEFDGMKSEEAKWKIADKFGERRVDYKLRDWVFSRQRYWGEPIPLIFCESCRKLMENSNFQFPISNKIQNSDFSLGEIMNPGWVAVPEDQLPITLPEVKSYEPTGTGESPLAGIPEWVNVKCPKCGGEGRRETNTMPQWAGSSWYYIAYCVRENSKYEFLNSKQKDYWLPVDLYIGGVEHATRHLIYARFWHKFLFDIGVVAHPEPFLRLKNQGLISGPDGRKMSKRWGNVINPDNVIAQVGADTLRVYEMFMGPFEEAIAWNTDAIAGSRRFLERVWRLKEKIPNSPPEEDRPPADKFQIPNSNIERLLHKTIKKVSEDIEALKFNTAISALMIFVNELEKEEAILLSTFYSLLSLLSPFAPHITEELWHESGGEGFISEVAWPRYEDSKIEGSEVTIVVQVNGRVRDTFEVTAGAAEEDIKKEAHAREAVRKFTENSEVLKTVYVPGKLLNIVTKKS